MATQFGTDAPFGLVFETGIITDSVAWNYANESKVLRNGQGSTTGKAYYDERVEGSIAGYIPTSTAFATTLASAITLVTAPTDYLKGTIGTTNIVETVARTHTLEDYQRIEVGFVNHPLIT